MTTYEIIKRRRVVMTFDDRPGVLQGTATVAGQRPAPHPFVNAVAHDASEEGELGRLMRAAGNLEELIASIESCGFRVREQREES